MMLLGGREKFCFRDDRKTSQRRYFFPKCAETHKPKKYFSKSFFPSSTFFSYIPGGISKIHLANVAKALLNKNSACECTAAMRIMRKKTSKCASLCAHA